MSNELLTAEVGAAPIEQYEREQPGARPVISLTAVRKVYGEGENAVEALKGVDFDVLPGRLTAIVGPSGSGKSTLLNLLGALDVPSSGQISFEGVDLAAMSTAERTKFRARNIGFIFQFLNLLPGLTCEQNVMLGGIIVGMDPRTARARAGELLDLVGLADMRRRPARKLSGGQMQRVAIARALINDPPLLLADEPTGNLDEENAEAITALLRDRAADGRAVVLVTHNDDLADRYADPVMVVRSGTISPRVKAELREMPGAQKAPPITEDSPAAPPPAKIEIDPAAPPDRLIADIALSLVRQGAAPRLRQGIGGKIEIEVDRR